MNKISVSDIDIEWHADSGTCTFAGLPVAMMWVDSTLTGLMSGVQSMVGTERFSLALQSEGRNSVEDDWKVIAQYPRFEDGFEAVARIAAVAGWGLWRIESLDLEQKQCVFTVKNCWETRYQASLGVNWGNGMVAGKLAGYCSRLFHTNCWATQTTFENEGAPHDTFRVSPSPSTIEARVDALLITDSATKADMAVALQKLTKEIAARRAVEAELLSIQKDLAGRVELRVQELRESETKFSSVIESSPMGVHIYELDSAGQLIFSGYNQSANRILGTDHRQFIGKTIAEAFPSLAQTEVPEKYKEICEKGDEWHTEQIDYDDNRVKGAFEVHGFQTSPGKMAVFFLDITDRLRKQENIKQLEKSVQQMKHIESLGVLAGGIAHDFNNILAGILGNISLVLESASKDDPATNLIIEAKEAALRARALTSQLLTFSKGGQPITETASIPQVIRESAGFVLRGSNIRVDYTIPDDLWMVDIDRTQMSQVIQNIILNAKWAMPEGGEIRVICENLPGLTDATIPLDPTKKYVHIAITDEGVGIDQEAGNKIFEPYYTTREHGSGLGLAVTYSIIKKHEGHITFVSSLGSGSTFHIFLPGATAARTLPPPRDEVHKAESLTLLIMDDEAHIRRLFKAVCTRLGYTAFFAENGQEAIALYRAHQGEIDLVIMDLTIPGGMGGKEAIKELRSINPEVRAIVSSGYSSDVVLSDFATYGFRAILPKPFILREFYEAIERARR